MAGFVRRTCDYCLMVSPSVPEGQGKLEELGWMEVLDGERWLDRCPVCSFTLDTVPITEAGR